MEGLSGVQLLEQARTYALEEGVELIPNYVKGHRLGDYPHELITREKLYDFQYKPQPKRWVLEIQIYDQGIGKGAFYEDILGI